MPEGFNPQGGSQRQYMPLSTLGAGGGALPDVDTDKFKGGWPEPADAEKAKPAAPAKDAADPLGRGAQLIGNALQGIAGLIKAKGAQLVSAIANIAGQLMPQLSPVFSGVAAVINALGGWFGGSQAVKVIPADGSMPMHFSTRTDYGWDVNPASALLSGRGVYTGPAQASQPLVIVEMRDDAGELINVKGAAALQGRNMRPARRLAYGN